MYFHVGTSPSLLVSQLNFCSKWADRGECESSTQLGTPHTLLYFQMQLTVIVGGLHCSLQMIQLLQEKGHILSKQEKPSVCSEKSDMKISVAHPGFAKMSWEFGKSLKVGLRCMVLEEACDAKSLQIHYYKVHIRLFCFSCALLLSFYMSKSLSAYNIILRNVLVSFLQH